MGWFDWKKIVAIVVLAVVAYFGLTYGPAYWTAQRVKMIGKDALLNLFMASKRDGEYDSRQMFQAEEDLKNAVREMGVPEADMDIDAPDIRWLVLRFRYTMKIEPPFGSPSDLVFDDEVWLDTNLIPRQTGM